jgi:hypothetical protein
VGIRGEETDELLMPVSYSKSDNVAEEDRHTIPVIAAKANYL